MLVGVGPSEAWRIPPEARAVNRILNLEKMDPFGASAAPINSRLNVVVQSGHYPFLNFFRVLYRTLIYLPNR